MSSGWMRSAPSGSLFRHAGVRKIWLALCMRRWPATSVNGYAGSGCSAAGSSRASQSSISGTARWILPSGCFTSWKISSYSCAVKTKPERLASSFSKSTSPRSGGSARRLEGALDRRPCASSPSDGSLRRAAPRRLRRPAASGRASVEEHRRERHELRVLGEHLARRAASSCRGARRPARAARRAPRRRAGRPWRASRRRVDLGLRAASPEAARRAARGGGRSSAATRS